MSNLRHRRLVVFLNVLARAGDGQLVKQGKKACGQLVEQGFGIALADTRSTSRSGQGWRFGPVAKGFLRSVQRLFNAGNAGALHERVVLPLRHQVELVAQVFEVVVDGRGRQQHDLGFHAGLNDVLHQLFIAAFSLVLAFDVVAKVMRFVNDNQVEITPVDGRQGNIAGLAAFA